MFKRQFRGTLFVQCQWQKHQCPPNVPCKGAHTKIKIQLYKKQISKTNFKSLPSALIFLFAYTSNMFLCLVFRSSHISLDIQARDVHLKTLRAYSNIWDTRKTLRHLGTRRALGQLKHLSTWILRHLGS